MLRDANINNQLWLDIVFQHHEKIDGCGYPVGLEGDTIKKEALIISLSDRYSAMISPRSYREGMNAQSALGKIIYQ
jgi:HD-GYP domain-containing protein (c-di-GMP phosphodiesterase class II)